MNDRDKINALWLTMELALNALEELGEEVRTDSAARVYGVSGGVRWDSSAERWAGETP